MCMRRCAPNIMAAASSCRRRSQARRVLDLGSGSGRDVYLISQLVGREGEVVGVDMTDEQLATAKAHIDWHMRALRLCAPQRANSSKAISRSSASSGSRPQSFDVVVSNCVINLSVDKLAVLRGAYDLLEAGRRALFRRCLLRPAAARQRQAPIPCSTASASAARSIGTISCPMAKQAGFLDPRLVTSRPIEVENEAMRAKLGQAQVLLGDLPAVQARRTRAGLRGLRPGGDL